MAQVTVTPGGGVQVRVGADSGWTAVPSFETVDGGFNIRVNFIGGSGDPPTAGYVTARGTIDPNQANARLFTVPPGARIADVRSLEDQIIIDFTDGSEMTVNLDISASQINRKTGQRVEGVTLSGSVLSVRKVGHDADDPLRSETDALQLPVAGGGTVTEGLNTNMTLQADIVDTSRTPPIPNNRWVPIDLGAALSGDATEQGITLMTGQTVSLPNPPGSPQTATGDTLTFANAGLYLLYVHVRFQFVDQQGRSSWNGTAGFSIQGLPPGYNANQEWVLERIRGNDTFNFNLTFPVVLPAGTTIHLIAKATLNDANAARVNLRLDDQGDPVSLFAIVSGEVAQLVAPAHSRDAILDIAGALASQSKYHGYDSATDALSDVPGVIDADDLRADTEARRAAFRTAIGAAAPSPTDEPVTFLGEGADLNSFASDQLLLQETGGLLANAPFDGPLMAMVNAGTDDDGRFNLLQQAWSLDRPGLYAVRSIHRLPTAPTEITAAWATHHARAQLPNADADSTGGIIEVLEDEPAHWTPAPVRISTSRFGTREVQGTGSNGIIRIATDITAFPTPPGDSGFESAGANRLYVSVDDRHFTGAVEPPYAFFFRSLPENTYRRIPMAEHAVRGDEVVYASSAAIDQTTKDALRGNLECYFSYVNRDDSSTGYIPGTYQPEGVRLSKATLPLRAGAPDVTTAAQLAAAIAAVPTGGGGGTGGLSRAQIQTLINSYGYQTAGDVGGLIAAAGHLNQGQVDGRVRSLARDFALKATRDGAARASLAALVNAATEDAQRIDADAIKGLPAGHPASTPVTALTDIRTATLGQQEYVVGDYTRPAYGVLTVADSGITGERGWLQGSYGHLDERPDGLNVDGIIAFDQTHSSTTLRGGVFVNRGPTANWPDALELDGTRYGVRTTAVTGFARYRRVVGLTAAQLTNGLHVVRIYDGTANRFGTEDIEQGDYRADTEALRWRELAGQFTQAEIESFFHQFARAGFEGKIPAAFIPNLTQAIDPVASVTATAANQANQTLVLSTATSLGETGGTAIVEFVGAGGSGSWSQEFRVADAAWINFVIAYGRGATYGFRLRSRMADTDIQIQRTGAGAWLNGIYRVYSVSDLGEQVTLPAEVTQAEAEAGTATDARLWSPERVGQAIDALAPVGRTPTVIATWNITGTGDTTETLTGIADIPEGTLCSMECESGDNNGDGNFFWRMKAGRTMGWNWIHGGRWPVINLRYARTALTGPTQAAGTIRLWQPFNDRFLPNGSVARVLTWT